MKKLIATRRRKVAAIVTLLALVAVGVGIAAWVISGTGGGRGKVGSLQAPTVTAPASFTGTSTLLPGGSGDVQVLVSNPNGVPLTITGFGLAARDDHADQPGRLPGLELLHRAGHDHRPDDDRGQRLQRPRQPQERDQPGRRRTDGLPGGMEFTTDPAGLRLDFTT
jgi:hypothetical protein